MRTRFLLSVVVVAGLTLACSKKTTLDSTDVTTHGMGLDYKVVSNGTSTDVMVVLHAGDWNSNEFIQLRTGDNLVLAAGGTTYSLQQHQDNSNGVGVRTWYGTSVSVNSGDFVVDFTRTQGASALHNKLTLPPPFNLSAPTGTISRKSPMQLSWDSTGSGYNIQVDITGDCIFGDFHSVIGEPGNYVINGGQLQPLSGHESDTCPVTIAVTRRILAQESGGNFSSEFGHESQRDAQQIRTVTITSGP